MIDKIYQLLIRLLMNILPAPFRKMVVKKNVQRAVININWLFVERVINIVLSFTVGSWVIRFLGPATYGKITFATSFLAIFSFLSNLGLRGILVKKIVENPEEKNRLLGTTFLLQIVGAVFQALFAVGSIFLFRQGDEIVRLYVIILSLGSLFSPLTSISFWFESQVKSKFKVIAISAALLIFRALQVVLILLEADVVYFVIIISLNTLITGVGLFLIYQTRPGESLLKWKWDAEVAKALLQESWPLILSAIALSIHTDIDKLIVGNFLGDYELGIFSASKRLLFFGFIPTYVCNSIFPFLIEVKKQNEERYYQQLQLLNDLLIWGAIIFATSMTLMSKFITNLLYGQEFAQVSIYISIQTWGIVFGFFGTLLSKHLIVNNQTNLTLARNVIASVSNVLLNLLLIPMLGILGAVIAYITSKFIQNVASLYFFKNTKRIRLLFLNSLNPVAVIKRLRSYN